MRFSWLISLRTGFKDTLGGTVLSKSSFLSTSSPQWSTWRLFPFCRNFWGTWNNEPWLPSIFNNRRSENSSSRKRRKVFARTTNSNKRDVWRYGQWANYSLDRNVFMFRLPFQSIWGPSPKHQNTLKEDLSIVQRRLRWLWWGRILKSWVFVRKERKETRKKCHNPQRKH